MPFTFRMEFEDGLPAYPPTFKTAVPNWRIGDKIPLGRGRELRVVEFRDGNGLDEEPVLVVKPTR